jgi:hypothetical protein
MHRTGVQFVRHFASVTLAATVVALIVSASAASDELQSRPPSWSHPSLRAQSDLPRVLMPPVDVERLLEEDRRAAGPEKSDRLGYPMKADITPESDGLWEDLPTGGRVWRVRVATPGALWTVLGFGTFRLRPGGELFVYDEGRQTLIGGFTSVDIRPHGQLWMPPVEGDSVVVELYWPETLRGETPNLHLGTVSHGYKTWGTFGPREDPDVQPDAAGACNIDVNCPLGADWQDEKRGVLNLLSYGSGFCSASLITNTAADCRNYVLTARHCISSQGGAASTTFQFNYERPGCSSGTAPTGQTITGSSLRASYFPSDMTLLEMDLEPPAEYQAFYNGWSYSTTAPTESWCIHHPDNDVKKITFNEDPLVDGQSYGPDHWRITEWEEGTTEPGSSGSPLFDQNHRIVGQLHGGTASCSSNTYDEYGKFDVSWTGGGTPATRLSDWLDPGNTGVMEVDGLDAVVCNNPQPSLEHAGHTIDDSDGNGDGFLDPGDSFTLEVSVFNAGHTACTGVAGTLTALTPGVTVSSSYTTWPDIPAQQGLACDPPHFAAEIAPDFTCGDPVRFRLTSSGTEEPGTWESEFSIFTGAPVLNQEFFDDMETGEGGWTQEILEGTVPWALSNRDAYSTANSWSVVDKANRNDSVLVMPAMATLPRLSVLRFQHRFNTENNRDGGVLEYSTDGLSWVDAGPLVTLGGYNSSIMSDTDSNLAGRNAWAGDSGGWQMVEVDLATLEGRTVSLRWRFATDTAVADEGWYVDDVTIESTSFVCSPVLAYPGEVSNPHDGGGLFTIGKDPGGYLLQWSAPAGGGPVDGYGLYAYELSAGSAATPACEADLGSGTSSVLPDLTADRGFLVVARNARGEGSYGGDSQDQERTPATGAAICP